MLKNVTRKQTVLFLCAAGIIYLLMELTSYVVYYAIYRAPFSFSEMQKKREEIFGQNAKTNGDISLARMIIPHPFNSYVLNPERVRASGPDRLITPYGFLGERDPIAASGDPNIAIVGLTGGSVAVRLFRSSLEILHKHLDKHPYFHGKKVIVASFSQEAYREPNQFFAVAYYLMQGGRLDLLINLDGYNEAVMGFEAQRMNTYPSYPSYWTIIFHDNYTIAPEDTLGTIAFWRQVRYSVTSVAEVVPYSVTVQTLWSLVETFCQRRAVEAEEEMRGQGAPYFVKGPDTMKDASPDEIADFEMRFWEQGSEGLFHLSQDHGFPYLHFLQACEFIPDSKTLTPEEEAVSIVSKRARPTDMKRMYPLMAEGLERLHRKGVNTYNLANIYKTCTKPSTAIIIAM